jgi:hypothetical protein
MLVRLSNSVEKLKFQFGLSVLELFKKFDVPSIYVYENYHLMTELARDIKFKRLIEEVSNELKERFNEFTRYRK